MNTNDGSHKGSEKRYRRLFETARDGIVQEHRDQPVDRNLERQIIIRPARESVTRVPFAGTRKGNAMKTNLEHKNTPELLAEAEELIRQINADALQYMQDDHRLVFEKHVEKLEKIKASAQVKAKAKRESDISDSAEGMHAAIQDIVKAMQELTHLLV